MPLKPSLDPEPTLEQLRALDLYLSRPKEMPVTPPPAPPETEEETLLRVADSEEFAERKPPPIPKRRRQSWTPGERRLMIIGLTSLVIWLVLLLAVWSRVLT